MTTAAISPPTTGSGMLYLFRKATRATIIRPTISTTIADHQRQDDVDIELHVSPSRASLRAL